MHPLEEVVATESLMGEGEVDALDLEGSKCGSFTNGMAGDAGISSHACEHLAGFDEVFG